MSRKERERLTIMAGVKRAKLTLVQAVELMGVCYRQSQRIWQRYQADGDAGLVHRMRGKPSPRHKPPELRARALARYAEERYTDFGPTLMAEQLAKEKLVVDHETRRHWRLAAGQHPVRRRQQQHRQWRERKPSFGAMVQLDGSHHDWFEGRGPQCVLMVMVEDATNRLRVRFFRGRNHAGQLRRVGRLGPQARIARQLVCGPGQHLSLRRGGEHRRTRCWHGTGGWSPEYTIPVVSEQWDARRPPVKLRNSSRNWPGKPLLGPYANSRRAGQSPP